MTEQYISRQPNIEEKEAYQIRDLMQKNPDWGRTRLSIELCKHWNWRYTNGNPKAISCRDLLRKLDRKKIITLPPPLRATGWKTGSRINIQEVEHSSESIDTNIKSILPVKIKIAENREEYALFNHLLAKYHYLGYDRTVRENIKYIIYANIEFENDILKARLSQNSSNSNRPPSTDIKKTIPNNREKSGKKPGGQPGREGINLEMVKNPDKTIIYKLPNICPHCLKKIVRTIMQDYEKRQEFDIPEPSPLVVTEHRAEIGLCEHCGKTIRAEFPENITAPTQYGHTIQSRAVYANQYQLIPYKRTVELLEVFFGVRISEGAIAEWNKKMYDALQPMEELIKQKIMNAPLIHADETSVRINKKLHYLHLTSTEFLTLFNLHKERSIKALMDIGILPNYSGIVVHDAYKMYFHFSFIHALCNAHNCRELKGVFQNDSLQWQKI